MDNSARYPIYSVSTQNGIYFVGKFPEEFDKITVTEKTGDGAYIIWYQLWKNDIVIKEINSRMVIEVTYTPPTPDPIPF